MKRMISAIIIAILSLSFLIVSAASSDYSIQQLQYTAVINSTQAELDDIDIKTKELNLQNVKKDLNVLNDMILLEVRPMELTAELVAARMTKDDHNRSLRNDALKLSYQILLSEKQMDMEKEKLKILNEKLTLAQAKYKSNTIVMEDLTQAEYNVVSKQIDINNIQATQDSLQLDLKRMTNLESIIDPIQITDTLTAMEFKPVDNMDSIVDNALRLDTTVYVKSEALKAKQKAMEIAKKLYRAGDTPYDTSVIDLSSAEINYKDAISALTVNIENKYNDLLNKVDDLELSAKYVDISNKKVKNAETKFSKGILSKETVLSEKEKLLDAEYARVKAIYDFNILKIDFNYSAMMRL